MKISTELLAAYAEGNVTKEERIAVRQYLMENPAKLESVMKMMDEDYELEVDDISSSNIGTMGHVDASNNFSDLCLSAAAFAPTMCAKMSIVDTPGHADKRPKSTFDSRLSDLLDELKH